MTSPRIHTTAIVFDVDGTLLDTMTLAPTAYADTIRACGGPTVSPADVIASWHIGPTAAVLEHFLGRSSSIDDIECYHRHFEAAAQAVRPFPGVWEMVETLSQAGFRLGVFTGASRRATTLTLAATGLDRFFAVVICGDEISEPKPAPDGLLRASHCLGASPTETIYVGDTALDLQCAKAAGSRAIHATWCASAPAIDNAPWTARRPSDIADLVRRTTI